MSATVAERIDIPSFLNAVQDGNAALAWNAIVSLDLDLGEYSNEIPTLLSSPDVETRLVGAQVFAHVLQSHGDVRAAAEILFTLVNVLYGNRLVNTQLDQEMMLANVLVSASRCLTEGGRAHDFLVLAADWREWLDTVGRHEHWRSFSSAWAESCLLTGQYEAASKLLDEVFRRIPAAREGPIERRLCDRLDDVLRAADKPDAPSATLPWMIQRSVETLGVEGFYRTEVGNSSSDSIQSMFRSFAAMLGLGRRPTNLSDLADGVRELPFAANPMHATGSLASSFLQVLNDIAESDTPSYLSLAKMAGEARGHALVFQFWEDGLTYGWLQSIALRRAKCLEDAAVVLADLRAQIRERQLGVEDPMLRAALSTILPHLWPASAQVLFAIGETRNEDLFDVLEESKARVLGDLITRRFAITPGQRGLRHLNRLLDESPIQASFLNLLLDDEAMYGIFVAQGGKIQSFSLPIGRNIIAAAAQELGFLNDGEPGSLVRFGIDENDPWNTDYDPVLGVLKPLGDWLGTLLERGVLKEGSVLCISPDGPLYDLPLGALPIDGVPMVARLGLTIVPSAEVLLGCASFRTGGNWPRAIAAVVPRSTEFEGSLYSPETYRQDVTEIQKHWTTEILSVEESDINHLLHADLGDAIVHLACHGSFDPGAPLANSGIALAIEGNLPPGRGGKMSGGMLTPQDACGLHARGSFIGVRACVSGKTTEVTSREALGMIWALFQSGACSLTAASWNADARSASKFFAHFYRELSALGTVALAHRAATLSLRAENDVWDHPYHYAAFTLFGYWA